MTELLPCPFCKGQAKLHIEAGSWGYYPSRAEVRCILCGASGPGTHDDKDEKFREHAEQKWNKRA